MGLEGGTGPEPVPLEALTEGRVPYLLTTAEDAPDPLPDGMHMVVLGAGERREVVLGAPGGLSQLPVGTPVGVSCPRQQALLRAHHPGLVPADPEADSGIVIHALWRDPSQELAGEVLEWDSWLPAPGQGIPVVLHTGDPPRGMTPDPGAAVVVAGERALARAFPGTILCVRGQGFGGGGRFHALLLSPDGRQAVRAEAQGSQERVLQVVEVLEARLAARGGGRVRGEPLD